MSYEFRNFKYSSANNSSIDLEFNGPVTGGEWWPYTYIGPGDGPVSEAISDYLASNGLGDVAAYVAPPISNNDVQVERTRRLEEGFDYDFGDARGIHRIATTPADMAGWDEVTTAAQAMIALGAGNTEISVVTETGSANVTATEWQQILLAAAAFRQPIWAGSFWLQAQDPIPADYASNNAYWST